MFKVRRVCLEHLRPLELSPGGFGISLSAGLQKPGAVGHDVHVDALVRRVTPDRVLAFINLSPRETATDNPGVNRRGLPDQLIFWLRSLVSRDANVRGRTISGDGHPAMPKQQPWTGERAGALLSDVRPDTEPKYCVRSVF